MGLAGTLDHSGVIVNLPGFYDSSDHDRHHSHFEVNYGFPSPYLDILHGTYYGNFLGWEFKPLSNRRKG